jgi:ribosomal protein L44E
MTNNKSKIPYEAGTNHLASADYIRARNEEMYLNKLREVTGNPEATFEDEFEWYKNQGKPVTNFSKTIAIRRHCQACNDQEWDSGPITCGNKWGKESDDPQFSKGCAFNIWSRGTRYIPAGSKKMTQKSAIKWFCMQCQGADSIIPVKTCTAFLTKDENGIISGCYLHPYRYLKNPWHTRNVSPEIIAKAQAGLKRWKEEQKNNKDK